MMGILYKLPKSKSKSSFKLKQKDLDCINQKELETIEMYAGDFIVFE